MANGVFQRFLYLEGTKQIGMTEDDKFWMALLKVASPAWTPVFTDDTLYDLFLNGAAELSVTGYSRKAIQVGTAAPAFTRDDPNLRIEWDFDDITWAALDTGEQVQGMLVYYGTSSSGDDATNVPVFWCDTPSNPAFFPYTTVNSSFTIQLNSEGFAWKKYCG